VWLKCTEADCTFADIMAHVVRHFHLKSAIILYRKPTNKFSPVTPESLGKLLGKVKSLIATKQHQFQPQIKLYIAQSILGRVEHRTRFTLYLDSGRCNTKTVVILGAAKPRWIAWRVPISSPIVDQLGLSRITQSKKKEK
jgi:hypothetical protein